MATLIPTIFSDFYTVALFFSSLLLLKLRVLVRSSISTPDIPTAAARSQYHTLVGTIEAKYLATPYSEHAENPKSATAECAVCLSDFCKGEIVRKLDCKHFFHRDFLDRWLTSPATGNYGSSSCSLCRARLDLSTLEEEVVGLAIDKDCGDGEWGASGDVRLVG